MITIFSFLSGQPYQVDVLREAFRQSLEDAEYARQWYTILSTSWQSSTDPLTAAYLGAQLAVLAKHDPLPWRKLDYLHQAEETINQALALHPGHPEIHFLRFSYQHHIPGFLGLNKELEPDRLLLVDYLTSPKDCLIDPVTARDMVAFLIKSGRCSSSEIQRLQSLIR